MATKGENIRNKVRSIVSNPKLKSTAILTHITRTIGGRGGYDGPSETTTSTETIDLIPSGVINPRIGLERSGDVKQGEILVLIRDDVSIDTDDKITFNGVEYLIREIRPIDFNLDSNGANINAGKEIIISRVQ